MDDRGHERAGTGRHRAHLNGEGTEMTNTLRPEVAAHLAEDAATPEELAELRALAALLGDLPQVAPRRTFILTPEQAAASGRRRAPRRRSWVWPTRWATAFAALCFAITLGAGAADAPTPTTVAPTVAIAAAPATATARPTLAGVDPGPPVAALASGTPRVDPTPTAVPAPTPPPPPAPAPRADWRPLQFATGALTALGLLFGFVLPPFLRRREARPA